MHLSKSQQQTQCSEQCQQTKFYKCLICMNDCRQELNNTLENSQQITKIQEISSSNFTFKRCGRWQCIQWKTEKQTNGSENTRCIQEGWKLISQGECTQSCCDQPDYHILTIENFNICIDQNKHLQNWEAAKYVLIGSVICAVIVLIVFGLSYIYCRKKVFPCIKQSQGNVPYLENQNQQENLKAECLTKIKSDWRNTEKNLYSDEICSICLDKKTNCLTLCGHSFHLICFKEWIQKNQDCPNCKSKNFNEMKIYCQMCKSCFKYINLEPNSVTNYIKEKKIHCDQCLKGQTLVDSTHHRIDLRE